ncbi:MAG: hydrolase 1, exosortase A system-associated [Sphingomonadaceae bacterium]
MSRTALTFDCQGMTLAATLDIAPRTTGLLYISGGNEIRSGAFSGQAHLAARIAAAGFPVFRFDRRGIGDSDGENSGFRNSRIDIETALGTFRAMAPHMTQVVGFGNCDAASALMLAGGAGCDGLVLSNPWTIENGDNTPPPSAVRSRYLEKLKNPKEIWRLLSGGVNLKKLARGLGQAAKSGAGPSSLAQEMAANIAGFSGPVHILLATSDRTAQIFENAWNRNDPRIARCQGASHAYVEPDAMQWLESRLLGALGNQVAEP